MTVLIGYDDVLFPTTKSWIQELNKTHGLSVNPNLVTNQWFMSLFPTLSYAQFIAPIGEKNFWKKLKPINGAVDALRALYRQGHDLKIVIDFDDYYLKERIDNLLVHFPFITRYDIFITQDKQGVEGDVLIDILPDQLLDGNFEKILITQPYNIKSTLIQDIIRASDIVHACKIVSDWHSPTGATNTYDDEPMLSESDYQYISQQYQNNNKAQQDYKHPNFKE